MLRKEKSLSIRGLSGKKSKSKQFRPNSAVGYKKFSTLKVNSNSQNPYNQAPPPIIFTMPNNKKMTSGMGNNIEREQLYENNMQLKESLNKLKRELAETKYYVVKKDIELREKEKILRECIKENDLESTHESKIEKAKESALLTLCKEKYNILKASYQKEIQENKILKANIKITKIKEFQIENDILNKELNKIKSLYENCKTNLKKYKGVMNDLNKFKQKFSEQHAIISGYAHKCDLLNAEIRNLKEERDNLINELELNIKKQNILKQSNDKLKIKNTKFLNQKKINEEYDLRNTDNEKSLIKFKKDAFEFKKAFLQKTADFDSLKKAYNDVQRKLNNINQSLLQPFQYKNIKKIEQENNPKNIDKIELYKSLYDESQMKNIIYEKYFKDQNINPKDIIRAYGYSGVLNTENRLLLINNKDKGKDKNEEDEKKVISEKEENSKNHEESKKVENPEKEELNNNNNDVLSNSNNEVEEKKENQIEVINDDIKTKISEDNFSNANTNTYTKANTNTNNINNNNNNNINNNLENEQIIDEMDETNYLILIHLFLKNFEANHITVEIVENKMQDIIKSFEGKSEATKEDFLEPFYNLFIESMKVTLESDKQVVKLFLSNYLDNTNGNTNEFYNDLNGIFSNLVDYSTIENNENITELLNVIGLNLKRYKKDLEKKLKEEDKTNSNLITFDIFRKIVNELNINLNEDLMELLIYKMKSAVPENHSIFDLNYSIMLDLLNKDLDIDNIKEEDEKNYDSAENENDDLSKKISDKLSEFKNNMIKNNTDLEKLFIDKIQKFTDDERNDMEVIEKDTFFEGMENMGVTLNDEIKETIYKLFISEDPICTNNGAVMMMDFKKLKNLFIYDSNEDNQ